MTKFKDIFSFQDKYKYLAHIKDNRKETLQEHTELANKYFEKIVEYKNLKPFFENLENLDKIIESLESGELSLDDAIKEYENAMKLIKSSSKILNEAEGKLLKVIEKNGEIDIEEI